MERAYVTPQYQLGGNNHNYKKINGAVNLRGGYDTNRDGIYYGFYCGFWCNRDGIIFPMVLII
jgi:hypothetical protein